MGAFSPGRAPYTPAHLVMGGTKVKMQTQVEIGVSAQPACGCSLPSLSTSHIPFKHHLKKDEGEEVESERVSKHFLKIDSHPKEMLS